MSSILHRALVRWSLRCLLTFDIQIIYSKFHNMKQKQKQFDAFSFQQDQSSLSQSQKSQKNQKKELKIKKANQPLKYRHLQPKPMILQSFGYPISQKIRKIDQQLEQNVKRRIQLERKLNSEQIIEKKKAETDLFKQYKGEKYKQDKQATKNFVKIQNQADKIEKEIAKSRQFLFKTQNFQKDQQFGKSQDNLIDDFTKKISVRKVLPVYTAPNQLKIQSLLQIVTFPQVPKQNLQKIRKECESLWAVHSPHSDIHYLLMIVYFHLEMHYQVRKHFKEIMAFKVFNNNAYWIAAESEFELNNHQTCIKLANKCMEILSQKLLPRFIYLQARSYAEIGNFINSLLCYNQLIKIKPKIGDYYLQRAILENKIGYFKQAKQDWIMFGVLRPDSKEYLKNKIICETNQIKKKEYLSILAKMY